jgi:phosphoribosylglycinamide formyltransferase-1
MERAKNHNIPYELIESNKFLHLPREEFDKKMIAVLKKYDCELVVLVGYMRLVSQSFIDAFNGNVMNIHPALLPSFKGMHAHKDVLEYGVKVSGTTIHFVDPQSDYGPIIIQKCVPVYDTDTEKTLGPRVLEWEHKIFPKAIELYCDKRLHVDGRIVDPTESIGIFHNLMKKILSNEITHFPLLLHSNKPKILIKPIMV